MKVKGGILMIWYSRDENGVEVPLTVSGGQTIQVNEMPAASSDYVGIVCQYIGETTVNYTHNYFYECIEDTSTNPATYSWVPTNVQAGDGSSVQADWDQADSSADGYIKNKPTIPVISQSATLTLTVNGWDSTTLQQTVTFAHDTSKRNVIDITVSELDDWAACGVVATGETASGISFKCKEIPESALTFTVCSMSVASEN